MDIKVDYLSFTLTCDLLEGQGSSNEINHIIGLMDRVGLTKLVDWLGASENTHANGRKQYRASLYWQRHHARIWYGGNVNHILVELPGTACAELQEQKIFLEVVRQVKTRVTRLDVACDSPDFGSPKDFISKGFNKRFKSSTSITEDSGETEYVGSMKSERFARVYRYNPPHPRAGITRVEYVYRSDFAKSAAQILLDEGLIALAAASGNTYGWKNTAWNMSGATEGKVRALRGDRHSASTIRWLHHAVKPALVSAVKNGLIDLAEFFDDVATQLHQQENDDAD